MPTHTLKVDAENNKVRIDILLSKSLKDISSRTFVKKLIDSGQVTVNQNTVKANYKVKTGDEIQVAWEEEAGNDDLEPEHIELDIFYEDEYLIVINKPAGMLVHPTHSLKSGTLVNALLHYARNLSDVNSVIRPGIVHRLDRETSGLILVAKDNKTHMKLAQQFERRLVQKRYIALVEGRVEYDEGMIDVPLGRHPRFFDKKAVQFDDWAKPAQTFYRVLKRFPKASLVALYPHTGRTHQLRVHMSYLGHPILGDDKYGKKHSFPRLALHAQSIGFYHPQNSAFIEFSTAMPKEFDFEK